MVGSADILTTRDSKVILGIDEVGRGPWAGPLVVGAAILKCHYNSHNSCNPNKTQISHNSHPTEQTYPEEPEFWQKLTDSKKLTAKRRQELAPIITREAITGLGWVSSQELDQYGISASLKLATRRAVKQILATKTPFDEIIIDGTVNFLANTPLADRVTTLPKADLLIREVSAASIIAKVARDNYMIKLADKYPGYGFENHVGYGTAAHRQALARLGITPEHRQSFRPIREIIENSTKNPENPPPNYTSITKNPTFSTKTTTNAHPNALESPTKGANSEAPSTSQKGQKAELAVASHLTAQNHKIIAHNFKTKTYEIDLISVKNTQIFFTEVKYSQNLACESTPLVRITPEKQAKMRFAAKNFCKSHPEYQDLDPILAVASVTGKDYQVSEWIPLV